MPLRYHEGTVTNEEGQVLAYRGARPSAGQLYDLLGVHMRNIERGPAPAVATDEERELMLSRIADSRKEQEAEFSVIHTINGTPAREHDRADVTLCYNDLMAFFSAAANAETQQPSPDESEEPTAKSTRGAKARATR